MARSFTDHGAPRSRFGTRPAAATQQPGRSAGAAMANAPDIVQAKDAQDGPGGLALLVRAEALRNPPLAEQFKDLLTQMRRPGRGRTRTPKLRGPASGRSC
jgi:hypothetical protein